MKRALLTTVLLALLAVASASAQTPVTPALGVKVKQCSVGDAPSDRFAVFEASMPRDPDAVTMGLRFRLYESIDSQSYKRVIVPGFSSWTRSAPNVAGFVFDKRVQQLASGARYRVTVSYAWYDADGTIVRKAQRTSHSCRQP